MTETGERTPATEHRKRMPAAQRRELVLEAAVPEFAAHGLAGTSTEVVARRAGISQPYLFRLFPTKKALFVALVDRCFRRVQDTFTTAAADLSGDEALAAMAEAYEQLLTDRTLLAGGDGRGLRAAPHRPDPAPAADAGLRRLRRPGGPGRDPGRIQGAVGADREAGRAAVPGGGRLLRRRHADERRRGDGPALRRRALDQLVPQMSPGRSFF